MRYLSIANILKSIPKIGISFGFTCILGAFFLGITDLDLVVEHYNNDALLGYSGVLVHLNPIQVLVICAIFITLIAWNSDRTKNLVGKISISGNVLIPFLFLIYVLIVVGFIMAKDITYPIAPPYSYNEEFKAMVSIILLANVVLIYIPFLVILNNNLSNPAPLLVILIPVTFFAIGIGVWWNYAYTGGVDIVGTFKRFCC